MRISDWSSDVCSSDLFSTNQHLDQLFTFDFGDGQDEVKPWWHAKTNLMLRRPRSGRLEARRAAAQRPSAAAPVANAAAAQHHAHDGVRCLVVVVRSEEHTSELQSLMRISYAVFCLKKKK